MKSRALTLLIISIICVSTSLGQSNWVISPSNFKLPEADLRNEETKKTLQGSIAYDSQNKNVIYFDGLNWQVINNKVKRLKLPLESNKSDYEGQIGILAEDEEKEKNFYISIKEGERSTWLLLNSTSSKVDQSLNREAYKVKSDQVSGEITAKATVISNFEVEKYAHSSSIKIVDGLVYVAYMCNEEGTWEGDKGQMVRLTYFNILNPSARTYIDICKPGLKAGITLDNSDLSVPNTLIINNNILRIFFRGRVKGEKKILYRDFNITQRNLSNIEEVKCRIEKKTSNVDLSYKNAINHLNFLFGSNHGIADSEDLFVTSEIIEFNKKLYTCLSIGGGLGRFVGSILMSSEDNGTSWTLLGAPDPRQIQSIAQRENNGKRFWEGAIAIEKESMFIIGRGTPGNGLHISSANLNDLYQFSQPKKIYATSNVKPLLFNYPNIGTILLNEGSLADRLIGSLVPDRTVLDVLLTSDNYNRLTKVFTIRDYNGIHTPSFYLYNDEIYITYTTGRRRLTTRNCSEIMFVKLDRRFFN